MPQLKLELENASGLLLLRPVEPIKGVTAVFTTRVALTPRGPRLCNYGFHGRSGARAAREKLCRALDLPPERLTTGHQAHTANVAAVTPELAGRGGLDKTLRLPDTDGLITDLPRTPLAVMTADCVPVLLADPVQRAVAAVHAGWRGSATGIPGAAVRAMQQQYGSRPRDIVALIGPHIQACCYEVGPDVTRRVNEPAAIEKRGKSTFLDLAQWNQRLLRNAGLLKKNIYTTAWCTACHTEMFYSYRADKKRRGSNASLIALQ